MSKMEMTLDGLEPVYKSHGTMRFRIVVNNMSDACLENGILHYQVLVGERVVRGVSKAVRPIRPHADGEAADVLVRFFSVSESEKVTIQARVESAGEKLVESEWQTRLDPA